MQDVRLPWTRNHTCPLLRTLCHSEGFIGLIYGFSERRHYGAIKPGLRGSTQPRPLSFMAAAISFLLSPKVQVPDRWFWKGFRGTGWRLKLCHNHRAMASDNHPPLTGALPGAESSGRQPPPASACLGPRSWCPGGYSVQHSYNTVRTVMSVPGYWPTQPANACASSPSPSPSLPLPVKKIYRHMVFEWLLHPIFH